MRKKPSRHSVYCRSYIVTLGLTLVAACVFIWQYEDSETTAAWPASRLTLFSGFLLGGSALILFGFLGPSRKMERWSEVMSRHEASLIILVLAYPVYLVISPFYSRR